MVDLPADVTRALDEAGAAGAWAALPASTRRRRLQAVETARRPETRSLRIADLVAALGDQPA